MTERAVVHLVPHTHWDREWYEPFQVFRLRLVDLVDQLLERMAADDRLRFTLDGQAATVDDYLDVRPEAEPLIRQLIAEGRLAIGPWQILLDEFLVSGETIVRNLEFGWERAESLGGAMPVGYLPDMFGHIAQMPQILRRAGIERAVVWRGVPSAIDRHVFTWRSPDGSSVETEYLVGGYGNGAHLFDVPDRLAPKLGEYRRLNAPSYGDHSLLAMYGTDHAVPSPHLADLVDLVNASDGDVEVRLATLTEYLERDRERHPGPHGDMPAWDGELRSAARANMLMNVISARVDLKAAAAHAERSLERYAEPLSALYADVWPRRLLELAWRRLVDNSAHDSICGCSHDAVVAQVLLRYAEAEQISSGLVASVLTRIGRSVPVGGWAIVNPSPVDRHDLVELDLVVPLGWTSVAIEMDGRLLATQEVQRDGGALGTFGIRGSDVAAFVRRRRHGRELFGRSINAATVEPDAIPPRIVIAVDRIAEPPELDMEELLGGVQAAAEADPDTTWQVIVAAADRRRVLARLPAPALGHAPAREVDGSTMVTERIPHPVEVSDGRLSNGLIEAVVADDGTIRLTGGGVTLTGVGRIVEGGDAGDSYNYGPPPDDLLVERPDEVDVDVVDAGPLRGELAVLRRYRWPRGLSQDISGRSEQMVEAEVLTVLELRADESFLRVRIAFDNGSRDHRVRYHIPLPTPVTGSAAEGQFAVVERGLLPEGGYGEVELGTFPAAGFVSVDGGSVLLDQVTEYEVVDGHELALTLLRSFGLISRNANPSREDPAGPELPVPAAQLMGPRTFAFAVMPHAGTWSASTLAAAEAYRHPVMAVRGTGPAGPTGGPVTGLQLEGAGVVISALRRRPDGWLEARVVNEGSADMTATLRLPMDAARDADLLGRAGSALPVVDGAIRLDLVRGEIRTVQIRPVSGASNGPAVTQGQR